jgi:hypothetical protein
LDHLGCAVRGEDLFAPLLDPPVKVVGVSVAWGQHRAALLPLDWGFVYDLVMLDLGSFSDKCLLIAE